MDSSPQLAIILFHKQSTSARVRFLMSETKSCCFGGLIPPLATLIDEETILEKDEIVATHPAMMVNELLTQMGLKKGDIELMKDFRARLDIPGQIMPIYLAAFKTIDPPFDEVEKAGAKFVAITEARGLPPAELQVLQKAYQYLMG